MITHCHSLCPLGYSTTAVSRIDLLCPFYDDVTQVVLMARGEDSLNKVAEEIKSAGGEVSIFTGDVSRVSVTLIISQQLLHMM